MGGGQPFMYDAVPKETSRHPYNSFDPKAVSRASLTPRSSKPKQDGPLVSFNQHPDSYLVLPYGNSNAKAMSPSVKKKVKAARVVQIILRCIELLGAIGLLGLMILITNVEIVTAWLMRIPAGFGILHTLYSICFLSGRTARRPPASTASYMLFAACLDVSLIPFYAFSAITTSAQYKLSFGGLSDWNTRLPSGQDHITIFVGTAFLCSVIPASLHLVSLVMSLWLAVTFRKIARLPPDMNPLEDNLTSRHKRNKSSLSVSTMSEKRLSEPLESKRSSGAPYEDVSRPPTIPFMHTRTGSIESFSTYHTTPPASRDGRLDLPSRQYQVPGNNSSPRASVIDLKRTSANYNAPSSPPKRTSYASLPVSEASSSRSTRQLGAMPEAWHTAESLPSSQRSSRTASPRKPAYQPLQQRPDLEEEDLSLAPRVPAPLPPHPKPLQANPPTPRLPNNATTTNNNTTRPPGRGRPLSEISYNSSGPGIFSTTYSDFSEISLSNPYSDPEEQQPRKQDPADQHRGSSNITNNNNTNNNKPHPHVPFEKRQEDFQARFYGDLKPATPPLLIGGGVGQTQKQRVISSGTDFEDPGVSGGGGGGRGSRGFATAAKTRLRNVSGKIAEEGRGGNGAGGNGINGGGNGGNGNGISSSSWGTRFRRISLGGGGGGGRKV